MAPFREPHPTVFDRIANFRDLGGHTTGDGARVSCGRLFRSGHLAHASDDDVSRLADLGVRRVFDFRTRADIEIEGEDRVPPGAEHLRLPMPDPAKSEDLRALITETGPDAFEATFGDGKAAALMARSAAGLVRDRREPFSVFLRELSQPEAYPALFHCSAGKDRAGWAGSLVLLVLGVDEEQIVEQYLLSNQHLGGIRKRIGPPGDQSWGRYLRPFLEVRREYIESSFAAMRADWGSFDRYLHDGLEITEAQRARLRESLLE
jgi:protein-tyrosine phosphatase